MRMIIVSGLSGSGKSIALQTLEDLNYYCVDNLPVKLLIPFAEEIVSREHNRYGPALKTTAIGIDARNFPDELEYFPGILQQLRDRGLDIEILFLHATDETLIKRYSETRRKHPLSVNGTPLADSIISERRLLDTLQAHANLVIDTSHTNVHELRQLVRARIHDTPTQSLSILFESFGYKHGVPADADFVFDVRCLPNPHWEPQLRPLTGRDPQVVSFLESQPPVGTMTDDIYRFIETWLPCFETNGRSYLTIGIGCTGGQHRSVYIAERLTTLFKEKQRYVMTRHRELT